MPYARAVAAALLTVAALITAANTGPAGTTNTDTKPDTTPVAPATQHEIAQRTP
ncbi:hypothetical protein OG352_22415 [Streptomyces sp. NBC_01485]|uniref:hypothetical protein n=1 Tax=Streptomyces sp. NBC_01485 TaxID=2903884 RepID=UPI002E3292B4|nr:hypothetical protein [Streptomyces sp. NBC_01485]